MLLVNAYVKFLKMEIGSCQYCTTESYLLLRSNVFKGKLDSTCDGIIFF